MSVTPDRNDPALTRGVDTSPTPQAEKYLVLSATELAKGFIRPVRTSYAHVDCDAASSPITTMGLALSETYARDPNFYGATYCCTCSMHRPVVEFRWVVDGHITDLIVGD